MPRRTDVDPMFAHTSEMLQTYATSRPMRLLSLLPSIHPSVGFAIWSALRLMLPVEGFKIHAVRPGRGPEAAKVDELAGAELDAMWGGLPQEIGGLYGAFATLAIQALFSGLCCMECVPAERLKGVARAWPVDSLSVTFIRPGRSADLEPFQKQLYPNWGAVGDPSAPFATAVTPGGQLAAPAVAPGGSSWAGGPAAEPAGFDRQAKTLLGMNYVWLNKEVFFWRAVDSDVDDPYGCAPYATALSEVLADLALMQDLRDAVHAAAWPRLDVGVNLSELHKVAVEVHRITDPKKAAEWVMARFDEVVKYVSDLNPDDHLVHDSNGSAKTVQPGGFQGLEPVLTFLRQRIVQSLKSLPTLMGINDNANFNYTSVEWGIYAAGLEALRAMVADVLVRASTLHLRLLGRAAVAKAEYTPIRTNDELVDANTKNVQIQNAMLMEKMGYMSHDEAGVLVTGHKPVAPPMPGALDSVGASDNSGGFGDKSGNAGQKNSGTGLGANKQGTSKEERQTARTGGRPAGGLNG